MKVLRFGRTAAVLSIGAIALSACGSDNATGAATTSAESTAAAVTGTLTGAGSTAQKAAMEAWAAGFTAANSGAQVQYSPDGSGAGRKAFLAGAAQFAGSDAYLKPEEFEASKTICGPEGALNIPSYVSPIAVAFNLPGIDEVKMDADTIAKVFRGEVKTWNDPAIASQNAGVSLPDLAITVVHRSDESGTTENFTEYLAAAAPSVWTDAEAQAWPATLPGENAKGTSGVVSTTTGTEGAITYADASAVGDLGKVSVKVGDDYTTLSSEAAAKAVEVAEPVSDGNANDMSLKLKRDTQEAGVYPIVLVSYHIFCSTYKDQATVDLVKAFGEYAVSEKGQADAETSAGSAPLSAALSTKAKTAIESITVAK